MSALGKRAIACDGFRWMERCADVDGRTVVDLCDDGDPVWYDGETVTADDPGAKPLPDLDDHGTQGCMLHLVAELRHVGSMFLALADVRRIVGSGIPYPEALVVALERGGP